MLLHLIFVSCIVLAFVGLAWYLLGTLTMDQRIRVVINFILVIGLLIWLFAWLLPKLILLI